MRTGKSGRMALALAFALLFGSCTKPETPPPAPVDWSKRDEIPPDRLSKVMEAHYRGLGHMERYEYPEAAEAFGEAHELAPGWVAGSINLAIAQLNRSGEAEAKAKAAGQEGGAEVKQGREEALRLLDEVIARRPEDPHAHFCRGVILKDQGEMARAYDDFRKVTELDPLDANAWLERGSTLTEPDGSPSGKPIWPGSKLLPEQTSYFEKSLALNPNLATAVFKLSTARRYAGKFAEQKALSDRFLAMDPDKNPTGTGDLAKLAYGEMGRYANVITPFARDERPRPAAPSPRFDPPAEVQVKLPEGHRWASSKDLAGPVGEARARFGQGMATFDADGDGRRDLYLTSAVVGPKGVHDLLLLNRGDGKFEDGTAAFGLPEDRAGVGVAAGDFDADNRVDLFLTGVGDNRLLRNLGRKFEEVTKAAGIDGSSAFSLSARWLDLDQDGDLDLYVINYAKASDADRAFAQATPGMANSAYRNDGKPGPVPNRIESNWAPLAASAANFGATEGLSLAFSTAFPGAEALGAGPVRHTAIAALDLDDDRDMDLVASSDDAPPLAILSDRAGAFRPMPLETPKTDFPISGLLAVDFDKDGRTDLAAFGVGGRASIWRNAPKRSDQWFKQGWESIPVDARNWRGAQAVDLDLDTWADLVGLPLGDPAGVPWARNAGDRLEVGTLPVPSGGAIHGFEAADLVGDPLPDLVLLVDGQAPRVSKNLGNGQHWLAVNLAGQWHILPERARTNSEGIGARLSLEGLGINVPHDHTTQAAGLGQSVGPVVLGMGPVTSAPLLRVRWPDGVIQCELNVTADKTFQLVEQNRKTGSCPVLFTWNGEKFECLGDFLGGGGLGYLVAPGVYGQPDRDESVGIAPNQLKAVDGVYRLSVVEPMDEVTYLDKLTLDVVDRPPGVESTPDERFAPEGPRPSGETIAWSESVEPARALDHEGRDVTDAIRAWDRRTVDRIKKLRNWTGYTEDHALILDFGDRLAKFGPDRKLVLCLAGWVEYPYSQTNYAASTAGVKLRPPVLEQQKEDGSWEVLDPHPGYPAGMPRRMTLDLTGKLGGPRCVLRLSTNMECFWDQAFVALADGSSKIRTTSLPVARAELRDRGYLRETSPDGKPPLLYEYEYVDPAPLARMGGFLTRHGDVARLLQSDDDHLCTVGPGDEARLEFDAKGLPGLPEGWTRSYVLRAVGYCKDADPFTAGSDSVGPLPWRAMPPYPFPTKQERPVDPDYAAYLREYQTRPAGVR